MQWNVISVAVSYQPEFIAEAREHCTRIYVPLIKDYKKVKYVAKPVLIGTRPAYGSYIFVRVRPGRLRTVMEIKGFGSLVMLGKEVAVITPRDLKKVRELEKLNFRIPPVSLPQEVVINVAVGDSIVLREGPFEGYTGQVIELLNKKSLRVKLGPLEVTVPIDIIAKPA